MTYGCMMMQLCREDADLDAPIKGLCGGSIHNGRGSCVVAGMTRYCTSVRRLIFVTPGRVYRRVHNGHEWGARQGPWANCLVAELPQAALAQRRRPGLWKIR